MIRSLRRSSLPRCTAQYIQRIPPRLLLPRARLYSSTSPQGNLNAARDRAAIGTFDWRAAAVFLATGVGLYFYFEHEKAAVQERKRQEQKSQKYGKALVGGPFTLLSATTNTPFTENDLLGKWNLIYFGFTNCPDICPEELDKMSAVVDRIEKEQGQLIQPIFISCDPGRDTPEQVKKYVADFHPRMVGLTGEYDAVKATCKAYRVYFSTPPNTKPGDDYLVDHSIFFYLMDPAGKFAEAFGKSSGEDEVCTKFLEAKKEWDTRPKTE